MPPKKKTANGKSGKDKPPQKRESVVSEGKDETLSQKSDESKSIGEYEDVGVGGGSRRGSRFDQKKAGGHPSGIDAEEQELQDMKDRREKLERTTTVLDRHDLVVQKLIMKAREDLVGSISKWEYTTP